MTKKSKFLISIIIFLVLILSVGLLVFHRKSDNSNEDSKTKLYNQLNEVIYSIFNTESYEYIEKNFIKKASDITFTADLKKFTLSPDYEGFKVNANIRKNKDNSHLTTDIRTTYKGIQYISGKFEYKDSRFKLLSPTLYDKVITGDFNSVKNSVGMIFSNNILYRLMDEFSQMFPDETDEISQNICVTQDETGYNFTINAEAVKLFLKCMKTFIFDSDTCQNIWSDFIASEYYANPNNSDYYTLEEYKAQYIKSNQPYIQNTFDIIADLINFDVTIHFDTDSKGNIISAKYNDGNDDIRGIIDLELTPYKNTYNINGYLSFILADNNYKLDLSLKNSCDNNLLSTKGNASIIKADNEYASFDFVSTLNTDSNLQNIDIIYNGSDNKINIQCEAKYNSLDGDIISITKGEELNLSDMNIFELSKLVREIQENLLNGLFITLH
ncbi:MAG: hypothetical protein IJC76_10625 [Lachnospiraceae bacterium]|nr:hypothetical protein [Lachnospiraceae bacterium]